LELINNTLSANRNLCEYALYVKALILRKKGKINESMELFRSANIIDPNNVCSLKQVARSLYLLGKHKYSIDC